MTVSGANLGPSSTAFKLNTSAAIANAVALNNVSSAQDRVTFATGRGTITLDNFGKTFDNATKKVLVWQLAIMSVYGVLRRITQTIQDWKDLELTLARISITTGAVGAKLQQYFRQVADIAVEFGMPIDKTLVGMDLALRATASLGKGAERTATAVRLLKDASTLANLTGMQYGQAMDILVGALRQTGMGLDEGTKLLDKWVTVAKNAAVSVNDLSQGFAIMADAAQAAGLTVDQINGLIAALSEKVTLGPVQIGNAIRAIMSTLYNEGSINILSRYGVAVKDMTGEARGFWDVMTQLSAMRMAGVLDESSWLSIARAAGGGARRYAQVLALLDSFPTAMRIANLSVGAQGTAFEANAKIVNTLANSFDKFIATQKGFYMTMGVQTGAISALTGVVDGLTRSLDMLSSAGPGVWSLVKAVSALVFTLGTLKIASAATGIGIAGGGWLGLKGRAAAVLGGAAGVPAASIAGTAAQQRALAALTATATLEHRVAGLQHKIAGTAATQQALAASRLNLTRAQLTAVQGTGFMAPGQASMLGMGALTRWPGQQNRLIRAGYAIPSRGAGAAGYLYGMGQYGPMYNRGAIPAGIPTPPTNLAGGMARAIGARMVSPMRGMGAGVGALGMGAATLGLTGSVWAAGASAIGSGLGAWFGGPLGLVAGGVIGGVIGNAAADAFVSQEARLKKLFQGIAEDFGVNLEGYIEPVTADRARQIAAEAAPSFPGNRLAEMQPTWRRMLFGGVRMPSIFGGRQTGTESSFNILGAKREGEEEWKSGRGALDELNKALSVGVISLEEYRSALTDNFIAWDRLGGVAQAYMTLQRIISTGNKSAVIEAREAVAVLLDQIETEKTLIDIDKSYSNSQENIKKIIEERNLTEWEAANTQSLLSRQLKMTEDDRQKEADAILGSAYAYGSYLDAVERLSPALGGLGAISKEQWLKVQMGDMTLAGKLVVLASDLSTKIKDITTFEKVTFGDIIDTKEFGLAAGSTISDIEQIIIALKNLEETGLHPAATEALEKFRKYEEAKLDKGTLSTQFRLYSEVAATYEKKGDVRLVDKETLAAYAKTLNQLPAFTSLAESLKEFEQSVITLVDPVTNQTLRLEGNTLALEMLSGAVDKNTEKIGLEAEYNIPDWYRTPNRNWSLMATNGGVSPNLPIGAGASVSPSGARLGTSAITSSTVAKQETSMSVDAILITNAILGGSYKILLSSQQYLSDINIGIVGLRQEISLLRQMLSGNVKTEDGSTAFTRITKASHIGVNTIGVRRT